MGDFSDKVENDNKRPADRTMFTVAQERDGEGWMERKE